MKKKTKQLVAALVMVIIFGMSSIAFIVSGFGSPSQQEFKPLQSSVVEGEIDQYTKNVYIQNGFTFLEVAYTNSSQLSAYVNTLPSKFVTPSGQQQLIVQKTRGGFDVVTVANLNGNFVVSEPTPQNIEKELCARLTITPIECAFIQQGNSSANSTA